MTIALLSGLLTGFALIIAIGAQNAYVLRLGIAGPARTIFVVVLICALSDAVLITAGVLGIGVIVERAPVALIVLRVLGAGFLIVYGILAARRAVHPEALVIDEPNGEQPARAGGVAVAQRVASRSALATAALTALAFTWLNPHVYLDTLVFLGSIANQQGVDTRWIWAAGAITASFVWFFGLGFGARFLRPIFARPRAWRVLDAVIAVVMIGLGLKLAIWG
jgi:L-lysine exporter family protein LysE/ArgO